MFDYDFMNIYSARRSPTSIHAHNNETTIFFMKYLMEKACSVFEWKVPQNMDLNFLLYVLYGCGYVGFINTKEYGVIPQWGQVGGGYNIYFKPKSFLLNQSTDLVGTKQEFNIHYGYGDNFNPNKDCCLLRLSPTYTGIMDIIALYADSMACVWEALGMNVVNSKLAYVFLSESKTFAETFKSMYDKIQAGEPAVFVDKKVLIDKETGYNTWDTFTQDLKSNFISSDLLNIFEKLENKFSAEVGIPNNGAVEKKAQITDDEVNMNNVSTYAKSDLWLSQLQSDIKLINSCFNIDMSVDYRYEPMIDVNGTAPDSKQEEIAHYE